MKLWSVPAFNCWVISRALITVILKGKKYKIMQYTHAQGEKQAVQTHLTFWNIEWLNQGGPLGAFLVKVALGPEQLFVQRWFSWLLSQDPTGCSVNGCGFWVFSSWVHGMRSCPGTDTALYGHSSQPFSVACFCSSQRHNYQSIKENVRDSPADLLSALLFV